jgi:hypothetical protein
VRQQRFDGDGIRALYERGDYSLREGGADP